MKGRIEFYVHNCLLPFKPLLKFLNNEIQMLININNKTLGLSLINFTTTNSFKFRYEGKNTV